MSRGNPGYKAFFSAGGAKWNLAIGRSRISWGSGESGNLMLGDQFPTQDYARFTVYDKRFKYTLLSSFFLPDSYMGKDQNIKREGFTMFLGHRIEFRFWKDRIGLVLNESVTYKTDNNTLSLGILNPFGFYHNEYIRCYANSLIVAELDFTPFKGINIYVQFAVDDFPLGEDVAPAKGAYPSAFGYIAGIKTAFPIENIVFTGSLEFALTDPFLYLRGIDGVADHGYGHDAIFRNSNTSGGYKRMFLGYKYGNDAIVLNGKAGIEAYGSFNLGLEATYMWHGNKRLDGEWFVYDGSQELVTVLSGDVIEKTLILSLNGEYQIPWDKGLSVFAVLDFISIRNAPGKRAETNLDGFDSDGKITNTTDWDSYNNVLGNDRKDVQFSFAVGYSF